MQSRQLPGGLERECARMAGVRGSSKWTREMQMKAYLPGIRIAAATLMLALTVACTPKVECNTAATIDQDAEKQAILAVIGRMEQAWNRGDFRGYMEGFANPDVIFVSRGEFQKD